MKISDRRLRISDSLKISDFSNSLGCCSTPKHPQQYAYAYHYQWPLTLLHVRLKKLTKIKVIYFHRR